MTTTIFIFGAFVIGFLLGDRRGVKQANAILDANMRELFKAINDERTIPVDAEEATPSRPSVH
ncbi:MAG: hypothetical protein WA975_05000 [Mesorhizobium sp.]